MVVDVVGQVRVQVSQWIVGQSRQVEHRLTTLQIRYCNVAQILTDGGELPGSLPERALFKKIAVQSDDFVPSVRQQRRHHRADISLMTRNQYPHFHHSLK